MKTPTGAKNKRDYGTLNKMGKRAREVGAKGAEIFKKANAAFEDANRRVSNGIEDRGLLSGVAKSAIKESYAYRTTQDNIRHLQIWLDKTNYEFLSITPVARIHKRPSKFFGSNNPDDSFDYTRDVEMSLKATFKDPQTGKKHTKELKDVGDLYRTVTGLHTTKLKDGNRIPREFEVFLFEAKEKGLGFDSTELGTGLCNLSIQFYKDLEQLKVEDRQAHDTRWAKENAQREEPVIPAKTQKEWVLHLRS